MLSPPSQPKKTTAKKEKRLLATRSVQLAGPECRSPSCARLFLKSCHSVSGGSRFAPRTERCKQAAFGFGRANSWRLASRAPPHETFNARHFAKSVYNSEVSQKPGSRAARGQRLRPRLDRGLKNWGVSSLQRLVFLGPKRVHEVLQEGVWDFIPYFPGFFT